MSSWLLLRGWGREARHWGAFPGQLAAMIPGARIGMLDLPGNGRFHQRASPLEVGLMLEHCREERGPSEPTYLVGLSMGAMVCLEWAAHHPAEVSGAVLINASFGGLNAIYERMQPSAYPELVRLAMLERGARREAGILRLTTTAPPDAQIVTRWARYAAEAPVSRWNLLRQLIAAARYRLPARKPSSPLLVLASAADRLVSCGCSVKLARQWKVPIEIHPRAGHDLALDDGAWTAERIAAWTKRT